LLQEIQGNNPEEVAEDLREQLIESVGRFNPNLTQLIGQAILRCDVNYGHQTLSCCQ
jgi:hypothetical protein